MDQEKGIFIVLEGTDGSGKTTQFDLLKERLNKSGRDIEVFDFPQYDKDSSFFIKEYLNGKYGKPSEIGPYTGSLFFALDRYHASKDIRKALDSGKVVLANRFTGSNMAHQGTNFDNIEQLRGYFLWLDQIEFDLLKIPRPDISVVLRVPADIAQKNVDKKQPRNYTDKKRDIHEADLGHMEKSVEIYDTLCQLFPKDFKQVDCTRSGELLSIDKVSDLVWQTIEPYLPAKSVKKNEKNNQKNTYLNKDSNGYTLTVDGKEYLKKFITSTDKDVYAFNEKLSPQTVAASMARLSRRSDSLKVTLLDEFTNNDHKDEDLIKRVLSSYGDDSVQQLLGQYVVVENASNILTKKLESSRLASYLEQSTRYIYFDKKDKYGNYNYFTPNLTDDLHAHYKQTMDQIFDIYSDVVRQLTDYIRVKSPQQAGVSDTAWKNATKAQACDAARPLLPVSTKSTVGIFASAQSIEKIITQLLSDELLESRQAGLRILESVKSVYPAFYDKFDDSKKGIQTINYEVNTKRSVAKFVEDNTPNDYSFNSKPITLNDFWPKNELDIVPEIVYEHSTQSLDEIKTATNKWSLDKKRELIQKYVGNRTNRRHKPGRAFEKVHYSWDIMCDFGVFRDLQRHRMVDAINWQKLSPRFGFEMPEIIEEAGLSDKYEQCFDLSLGLYSAMQQEGLDAESQYATLLGHRMRWKVTFNARQAFHMLELRTTPQGHPGYRKIAKQMHEMIAEVHPIIASSMNFINTDESPKLSRIDSEMRTESKLKSLR